MAGWEESVNRDAREQLIEGLNKDLQAEFQAIIMYRLYASMVQGPYRQELRTFFANEIPEELLHAQMLADKIAALGGTPAATPAPVTVVSEAKEMLEVALEALPLLRDTWSDENRQKRQGSTAWLPNSIHSSRTSPRIATNCDRCWHAGRRARFDRTRRVSESARTACS
jgi:bacterioferritin